MKKEITYHEAFQKLEDLIEQLESDKIPLDQLPDKVKEGHEWLAICENRLRGIEKETKSPPTAK